MTIPVLQDEVLLRPADVEPSHPEYEILGTFNPGVTLFDDGILLLVRVAEAPAVKETGYLVSPRFEWRSGTMERVADTCDPGEVDTRDPRIFRLPDGRVRLRYISHLRLARLNVKTLTVEEVSISPDLMPCEPWEEFGIEDARITHIGDTYYITYVAISRQMGVATALMTTKDFQTFKRHGIIFPTENKDVVILPEKWNGNFVAYLRPVSNYMIDTPSVETSLSPDASYWGRYRFLFGPREGMWDSVRLGAGPPPVRLPEGWLLIYHGVSPATEESPVGRYCTGAVLLDGDDPQRLLARSEFPILCPDRPYERSGYTPNVIFPTGAVLLEGGEEMLLLSGGADKVVSLLKVPVASILEHLHRADLE